MMSLPSLQEFIRDSAPQLPAWHWAVLGGLAVAVMVFARGRGRRSVYGAAALAAAVVLGLGLLDALALVRIGGQHKLHPTIDIVEEWRRLTSGDEVLNALTLFNLLVFVPFGAALEEALATANPSRGKRRLATADKAPKRRRLATANTPRRRGRIGYVALAAFLLSLCIETLQLRLHIGMFEVTDLLLNTAGAVLGAALSLGLRRLVVGKIDPYPGL